MQASLRLPSSPFLPMHSTKISNRLSFPYLLINTKYHQLNQTSVSIKAAAFDTPEVDYNSMAASVFPAEACETVGGVACDVEMFPETKLKQEPNKPKAAPTSENVDREYLQYDGPKTVFIAEACDDLGGEFCDPAYQTGSN